jgi:saccharopine dehydrogenase-like NADP-dependent oxidoreductase
VPAGFEVTAVSRTAGAEFPSPVKTTVVDYSNHQQLVDLFKQHDVVVEAFNPSAAVLQPAIVEAALKAGIKHLITPDFACDTFNKDAGDLLIYDVKIEAQKELEKRVKGSGMKWTGIITGGWYDWGKPT